VSLVVKRNPNISLSLDHHGFPQATGLSFSETPQVFTSSGEFPIPRYPWQLFKGSGWPMSIDAEEEFILDVTVAAKGVPSEGWERSDATMLLAALRTSASWDEVVDLLPGISAPSILGAYRHLEAGLKHASVGWSAITDNPACGETFEENSAAASLVLSAAVSKLATLPSGPRAQQIGKIIESAARIRQSVDTIHTALEEVEEGCLEGIELGRLLFSVGSVCLYADPCFVPQRVGELSPLAVSVLARSHSEGE
jgi:hypothetical protein